MKKKPELTNLLNISHKEKFQVQSILLPIMYSFIHSSHHDSATAHFCQLHSVSNDENETRILLDIFFIYIIAV